MVSRLFWLSLTGEAVNKDEAIFPNSISYEKASFLFDLVPIDLANRNTIFLICFPLIAIYAINQEFHVIKDDSLSSRLFDEDPKLFGCVG